MTGIDEVILRIFETQKLWIATVYLKFLQRRKDVKEQAETVRLFRYNLLMPFNKRFFQKIILIIYELGNTVINNYALKDKKQ